MRTIVVVVNGEYHHDARLLRVLAGANYVIAADGGANWLASIRQPDLLIGDMDSVNPALLARFEESGCAVERYPAHKDETDTELALLAAVERAAMMRTDGQPARILVLGALGGRIDHELANVMLLTMPQLAHLDISIFDGVSYMSLIRDEMVILGQPGDLVSLIPLGGPAHGINTRGLEYPLHNESLFVGPARGVSNVLLGDRATVELTQGMLLMVHTPFLNLEGADD